MQIIKHNRTNQKSFEQIKKDLPELQNMYQFFKWAATQPEENFAGKLVSKVVEQDEFTRDIVVAYRDIFLVFDTT